MICCQNIWFHTDCKHIRQKMRGGVLRYINKVKSRHGIELPTTCGYQNCGEKRVLMLELCLLDLIFHYQYYTTYCIFFHWAFYHFTCLPILRGDIIRITNYDNDKYFTIAAWGESGGSRDAKVKEK